MEIRKAKCIKITYLYNNGDKSVYESLQKNLIGLQNAGLISELTDPPLGGSVLERTMHRLMEAQIILLLVSPNLEADETYTSQEIVDCIRKCKNEGIFVWPIIVRDVLWKWSPFKDFSIFFGEERSIMLWSPSSEAAYKPIFDKVDKEVTYMLAEKWVQEGDDCYHKGLLDEALVAYDHSLYYKPDYPYALLGKWRVFYKRSMYEEANEYHRKLSLQNLPVQKNGKDVMQSSVDQLFSIMRIYCKGCMFLESKNTDDALIAFRDVLQQIGSPTNKDQKHLLAEAHYGIGECFLIQNRQVSDLVNYYERSGSAYRQALDLEPNEPKYKTGIARAYLALAERQNLGPELEQALFQYEQCLKDHPDYAPSHTGKGRALYLLNRLEEALAAYDKALEIDPYDAEVYGGKGYTLLELNRFQDAIQVFDLALHLDEKNGYFYYGKAQALANLTRYREALDVYDKALALNFRSKSLQVFYANTLQSQGEIEKSVRNEEQAQYYFERAMQYYNLALGNYYPDRDYIHYHLAKIYYINKNWDRAMEQYRIVIGSTRYRADASFAVGRIYAEHKRYQDAFMHFDRARSFYQNDASKAGEANVEVAYGDVYCCIADENRGDLPKYYECQEKACNYYQKALDLDPHNALAYVGLGKTYVALRKDHARALEFLDRALELDPQLAEPYFLKGKCYDSLSRYADALTMYDLAIKAGFDNASLRNAYGSALLSMGRDHDAAAAFERATNGEFAERVRAYGGQAMAFYNLKLYQKALSALEMVNKLSYVECSRPQYKNILQDIYVCLTGMSAARPHDASLYRCKGDALRLLNGPYEEALAAYNQALSCGGTSVEIFCCRAYVYEKMQNYQSAYNDYDAVLKLDPNNQEANEGKDRVAVNIIPSTPDFVQKFPAWLKRFTN